MRPMAAPARARPVAAPMKRPPISEVPICTAPAVDVSGRLFSGLRCNADNVVAQPGWALVVDTGPAVVSPSRRHSLDDSEASDFSDDNASGSWT